MRDLSTHLTADWRGCEEHGLADMTEAYLDKRGFVRKPRCLVCQRNRHSKHHYNGTHCVAGHRKTPQTWVLVGKRTYRTCRPCSIKCSRARYARYKQARSESK